MHRNTVNKTIKRSLLGHLFLCGLLALSSTIQAATPSHQAAPITSSHRAEDQPTPLSLGQGLIPANGNCLYTTIIMGYLLPVKQDLTKFTTRIDQLFGMQLAGYTKELSQNLQNLTSYLTYLRSDNFNTLVTAFMGRMQIKKGTWGGPQEIQTIATKLKVNIQAYYPDPSNLTNLVQSDLTKPAEAVSNITIHIMRDRVHPEEVLTQAEKASAGDNLHYQHYRLKYALDAPLPLPMLPTQQSSISHTIGLPPKSEIQPYALEWMQAATTGDKKSLIALYDKYNIDVNISTTKGSTALLYSIYNGHLDCVKYLVEKGADINKRDKDSYTPLLMSAYKGHFSCMKYLLQQGANIHDKDQKGNTVLLYSAYLGCVDRLQFLVQQGADLHNSNTHGYTAMLYSAYRGHLDCLQWLAQQGARIHAKNKKGNTALLLSAYNGHLDCLQSLCQQGAGIRDKNENGNTALLLSACNGHLDCVKYLIQQGANIHHTNNNGNTALLLSACNGHLDCAKLLIQQGAHLHHTNKNGYTALILSLYKGHLLCTKYIVQQGAYVPLKEEQYKNALKWAKVRGKEEIVHYLSTLPKKELLDKVVLEKWFQGAKNGNKQLLTDLCNKYIINVDITRNPTSNTALLYSAYNGHLDCVKYLVQQGANIHSRNEDNYTALLVSAYNGHLDCLKFLLQQGADIHIKHTTGNTALLYSAYGSHLDCVKFFIQQGANIHDKNENGYTAFLLAAYKGNIDCVKFLIQQGANIHDKNENRYTAFLLAAYKGDIDCLKFLLQQGANIHDKDENGYTAFLLTAYKGDIACVKFLVESGANVTLKGYKGKTALQWAREKGQEDVINYLSNLPDNKNSEMDID